MPAAASYLRGNDYNTLKFRPFDLPVNDIAKTIMAKTQYWNEGASKVKARYEDALGLSLTNAENQQIKKDYIAKSEEMIRSMSSQNLGNPDVQQAGVGIFKNLFEDEGIIYDDQFTKHLGKVHSDYYNLLKTDPKKASSTNLAYAMEDAEAFRNNPDRNSGKEYYNRRREYTPYYDPADDIDAAMKHCKASTYTQSSPYRGEDGKTLTGYDLKTSDKQLSSAKVSACFQEGLSGQAKEQLNINGYMAFRNNKPGLANEYSKHLHVNAQALIADRTANAVKMADLLKRKQVGKLSPQDDEVYKHYAAADKAYSSEINNITDTITRLTSGDYSPLDKDYAGISGLIYTSVKTSSFGNAFSYQEYSKLMGADPVGMLHIKQEFDVRQQDDDQNFRMQQDYNKFTYQAKLDEYQAGYDMELTKARAAATAAAAKKKAEEEGTTAKDLGLIGLTALAPLSIAEEDPNKSGFPEFMQNANAVTASAAANNETIKNILMADTVFKETIGKLQVTGRDNVTVGDLKADEFVGSDAFKQYVNNAKEDTKLYPDVREWRDKHLDLSIKGELINQRFSKLEAKIPKKYLDRSRLDAVSGVTLSDGTVVTPQAIQDYREGKSNIQVENKITRLTNGTAVASELEALEKVTMNGKTYNIKKNPEDIRKIRSLLINVGKLDEDNTKALNKARNQFYTEENYKMTNFFSIDDQKNDAVVQLDKLINELPKGDIKEKASIQSYDPSTGDVIVRVPSFDNTNEGHIKEIQSAGLGGANVEPMGSLYPNLFKIKGLNTFNESAKLGLRPEATQNAILLKNVADVSVPDPKVKLGQTAFTLPVAIKSSNSVASWKVKAVKKSDGGRVYMQYILLDELEAERGRDDSPFKIMKRVSDLTKAK